MPVYTLADESSAEIRQKLKRFVPLILLASLPVLIFVYAVAKDTPLVLALTIAAQILVISVGIFLAIKIRSTIRLITDNDRVTYQRTGKPPIVISRQDIARIVEDADAGLTIESIDPTLKIYASKQFQNYEKLRFELNSWAPIQMQTRSRRPMLLVVTGLVLMVFLALGAFIFKIRECFYGLLLGFAAALILQLVEQFRSAMATRSKSKLVQLIFSSAIIIYLAYVLIHSIIGE